LVNNHFIFRFLADTSGELLHYSNKFSNSLLCIGQLGDIIRANAQSSCNQIAALLQLLESGANY